jgi:hypothetical protein
MKADEKKVTEEQRDAMEPIIDMIEKADGRESAYVLIAVLGFSPDPVCTLRLSVSRNLEDRSPSARIDAMEQIIEAIRGSIEQVKGELA